MNLHPDIHGDVTFNAHALGTPMEAQRDQARRLERLYDKAWKIGAALLVTLVALWGYGQSKPQPINTDLHYRVRATNLSAGQRVCELDLHEQCLVCMHRDTSGMPVVSTHC